MLDTLVIPPLLSWLGFAVCAMAIWYAGSSLAYLTDALAERFNLARSLAGLLILSLATSLPEVATTVAAAMNQSRELVLNNLFGGIALQTSILAVADFWAKGAITNYPRKANHALEATLLLLLLGVLQALTLVGEPLAIFHIGYGTVVVALCYSGTIWLLRRYDAATDWVPVDLPDLQPDILPGPPTIEEVATRRIIQQTLLSALAILLFGTMIVLFSERIATQSGLGTGFVGVTFLAAATSLPELTTTIAAVRLGAYTMAISNIFGSNLIMIVLVFPADILVFGGPILRDVSLTVQLSLTFGMIVTAIYLVGLIVRRKPRIWGVGLDSIIVIVVFLLSIVAYLHAGR